MRIESTKRQKKPNRRLPEQEIREAFRDGRVWVRRAQVFEPDGAGSHFKIHVDSGTGARKVMIEVMTLPEGEDLTCQLATRPTWYIPTPGTVVLVSVPSGELDHCPAIVGIEDSGEADEDIDPSRTLVATDKDYVVKAPTIKFGSVGASHPVPQGDSLKTMLDALMDALTTFSTGLNSGTLSAQAATLAGALPAIKVMTYNSDKVKTE